MLIYLRDNIWDMHQIGVKVLLKPAQRVIIVRGAIIRMPIQPPQIIMIQIWGNKTFLVTGICKHTVSAFIRVRPDITVRLAHRHVQRTHTLYTLIMSVGVRAQ
jgi:hypothetical protein